MAVTTVNIHGKAYQIKTSDGQENHVQKLAHELNQKMFAIGKHLPNIEREYLLVLASIMSLDEALESQSVPEEITQEIEAYKESLQQTEQHIEELKIQLKQFSKESMDAEKEKAIQVALKKYEDEQTLKFENQRKQYEKQIADLQMQIVENHNSLSQTKEFEDYLESMLKKQEEDLTDEFNAKIKEIKKCYEVERENSQKMGYTAINNMQEKSELYVDPAIDLLKTVANRLEK